MSKVLRKAFLEVTRGYSSFDFRGKTLYIKHLSHSDHVELEDIQDKFEEKARISGAPTEKQRLEFLKKEGLWTDKDEKELFNKKEYVQGLERGKKNLKYPSMLGKINEDIKKENEDIFKLQSKKAGLIGITVESYATKLINDYYVIKSIFEDVQFNKPLISPEEYDELDDNELTLLFSAYFIGIESCSDNNLKKLSIQDFYKSYYYLCEDDFFKFFGIPISKMTYLQIKLANYSRYYNGLLRNVKPDSLPEDVRNDPDKIADYVETLERGKKSVQNSANDGKIVGLVGATSEDIKALTGQEATKAPNKPMTMQEMMKMYKK